MRPLLIGEVARRTGIRTSALRYYERTGIVPPSARVSGRRHYDAAIIRHIEVLLFAQQAGFTLQEIKTLFHGFDAETPLGQRWHTLARKKLKELEVFSKRLKRMRRALELGLKCGCMRIEDCSLIPTDAALKSARRPGAKPANRPC
jgi:MerR family transcriptional regulator, redox-sensitive transcriptional activator SoxR